MEIKPYKAHYLQAIIHLSLRAWTPVFKSIKQVMSDEVYAAFYPDRWQTSQQEAVAELCTAADSNIWVATEGDRPLGFVAVKLYSENSMGEIYMLAVDPDFQGRGIGTALAEFALDWMREAGMSVAMVETGGDIGHDPARHTYEKIGFELLPIARYFKKL
ncbi:GNAT family N-acetyltransferase [Roseofilum casamattae]|uniref:GNAT family N-acetyltransferase n=1 Tax=Roseofilum casamattae BLCC-M143 TaxID=3022442 RepID=A0ABT7C2V3_9CYAN|nr:GNAT family N-acetyltransferase [Roseofilum casamattae]MDJ1185793.1 GNAT family N-acetyltransferase [Roseofilum casamattae BLCC-M143]